jgi:hypothetical protein
VIKTLFLSFRGADCDANHYLVVAELTEKLSKSKQAAKVFDMQISDLKKAKGCRS